MQSLDPSVRGSRVDRLIRLVERALSLNEADAFSGEGLEDIGEDPSLYSLAFATEAGRLDAQFRRLGEVLRALIPLLPPQDASQLPDWLSERPWYPAHDHISSALRSAFDRPITEQTSGIIAAVQKLDSIRSAKSPRDAKAIPAEWLVRAVMYYRSESDLPLTISWNMAQDPSLQRNRRRQDVTMSGGSETARLIEATANAFQLNAPTRTLAHLSKKYAAALAARSPDCRPRIGHFATPHRYLFPI